MSMYSQCSDTSTVGSLYTLPPHTNARPPLDKSCIQPLTDRIRTQHDYAHILDTQPRTLDSFDKVHSFEGLYHRSNTAAASTPDLIIDSTTSTYDSDQETLAESHQERHHHHHHPWQQHQGTVQTTTAASTSSADRTKITIVATTSSAFSFSSTSSSPETKTSPLLSNATVPRGGGMSPASDANVDFIVRALHAYHTDNVGYLSFSQFQLIKVTQCEESGWWLGESESCRGWFPSNHVERVAPVYEAEYHSRPTSISSEDFVQISTNLDGVHAQFLGEPTLESISDNFHKDWNFSSNSPSLGRNRGGQLAFPPFHLSIPLPTYGSESSTDVENDQLYNHTASSSATNFLSGIPLALSDFVAEVTLCMKDLQEAVSQGAMDRYQPIVTNIIACVKALLIFTNTITRDSPALQPYPDLAKCRRIILRALGKLCAKCRVANGSQSLTTVRQRQFATEKLSVFGAQVLNGISEFTRRAQELGLQTQYDIMATSPTTDMVLDMALVATTSAETESPALNGAHGRTRRRVSRANSSKGFKSFKAVRQWKADHLQKYNAAKEAVETLFAEYMDCLNGGAVIPGLDGVLRMTIQSAQTVDIFVSSAEEMKARTSMKEDNTYSALKVQLSTALQELFEYVRALKTAVAIRPPSTEAIINKLMSLTSVLLQCLVDLDVQSKGSQESTSAQKTEALTEDLQHLKDRPSSKTINTVRSGTPPGSAYRVLPKSVSSTRNTAPAMPRSKPAGSALQTLPLNRKFASLNSLSDRYKRDHFLPERGDFMFNPDTTYGEAHDLNTPHPDHHRPNHDSAVVILSAKNTPHHSIMNGSAKGHRGGDRPIFEEEYPGTMEDHQDLYMEHDDELPTSTSGRHDQFKAISDKDEKGNGALDMAIKDAERKITSLLMPTTEPSHTHTESILCTSPTNQDHARPQPDEQDISVSNLKMISPTETTKSSFRTNRTILPAARPPRTRLEGTSPTRQTGIRLPKSTAKPDSPQLPLDAGKSTHGESVSTRLGPGNRNASSANTAQNSAQGPEAIQRPSGIARARSPIPLSPWMETSKRMPRPEFSPHPHSPSLKPETTTFGRHGASNIKNADSDQLSITSNSRSNSTQQRLPSQTPLHAHAQPSISKGTKATLNVSQRAELQARDETLLSGLSTPTTPPIQSFLEGNGPRRPTKSHRRESVASNVSAATESSSLSDLSLARPIGHQNRANLLPHSPTPRSKMTLGKPRRNRLSGESYMSVERQQQPSPLYHQTSPSLNPKVTASGTTQHRPRLNNRVGQSSSRISSDSRSDISSHTPWFLEEDYGPDEVMYNDKNQLVGATLNAYIGMLTSHSKTPDPTFVSTFFITFRLFVSPLELTNLLVKRFVQQAPPGLGEHEHLVWAQQKQERIQKRIHVAVKTWLDSYWVSEKDRDAFKPIMEFVTQEMMEALPGPAGRLLDMLNQWVNKRRSLCLSGKSQTLHKARSCDRLNQHGQESSHQKPLYGTTKEKSANDSSSNNGSIKSGRRGIGGFSGRDSVHHKGPPVPLVNKALLNALSNEQTMRKVPVTDIKPIELARQLTIMVGKLYRDIPYLELLGKDRPNCSLMIQASNKITIWVTDSIVDEEDVKKRIGVVKHWIEVGEECLKLNNFDTLTAISCAIESTPVKRLYITWEGINKGYFERSQQLKKMISSDINYSVYRAKLKTVSAPCIPFLGLYLTVIAYIEDGNSTYKDTTPAEGDEAPAATAPTKKLLRYGRFFQLARAAQEFRDFQGVYELLEVPRLRDYILKCIENQDSERSYRKSLAIEPRRPAHGSHGGSGGGGGGGQGSRFSGGNSKGGLFHGGISSSDVHGPPKSSKLSFFRKSTRNERS